MVRWEKFFFALIIHFLASAWFLLILAQVLDAWMSYYSIAIAHIIYHQRLPVRFFIFVRAQLIGYFLKIDLSLSHEHLWTCCDCKRCPILVKQENRQFMDNEWFLRSVVAVMKTENWDREIEKWIKRISGIKPQNILTEIDDSDKGIPNLIITDILEIDGTENERKWRDLSRVQIFVSAPDKFKMLFPASAWTRQSEYLQAIPLESLL